MTDALGFTNVSARQNQEWYGDGYWSAYWHTVEIGPNGGELSYEGCGSNYVCDCVQKKCITVKEYADQLSQGGWLINRTEGTCGRCRADGDSRGFAPHF